MTITQKLAEEIIGTKFEDLPSATVDRVKMAVMDDVGCAFMGYQVLDKDLVDFAKTIGGIPESTIIGDGSKVSCGLAAGVNADMSANSDFYEAGPGGHSLTPIAETALAVGERVGASGKDIITAIALSYELGGRFVDSLKDKHPVIHRYPFHNRRHHILITAICAAKLLGLNAEQVNHALGIAWMYTPPGPVLIMNEANWYRGELFIWSCQLGVQAALLSQKLADGPEDLIDNAGNEIYNVEGLTKSPKPHYYVINALGLKPWLGSAGFMGAIEITKNIVKEENLKPEDIEKIVFRGSKLYVDFFHDIEPKNYLKTRRMDDWFTVAGSLPWSLANAILGYESALDWVSEERLRDEAVISLAKKVKTEEAESWLVNEVEIVTKKGTYKKRIMREDFLGGPKRPMSWEQAEGKFLSLSTPAVGDKKSKKMVDIFRNLQNLQNIRILTKLYQR